MNTPAHLIFGLTAFGNPKARAITAAALAGAIIPDLSLYLLAGWHLFVLNTDPNVVFDQLYFSEGWQAVFRVDNSFIIWGVALGLALMAKRPAIAVLCTAALLHLALDFPVHNDDARAHFWPLTNWKFISPVSYWDGRYYGHIVGRIEAAAVVICGIVLWRRFASWIIRGLVLALVGMEMVPVIAFAIAFPNGA